MKQSFVAELAKIVLPESCSIRRDETRPIDMQDESYKDKYDYRTLFFDAVDMGDRIAIVSPPFLNLANEIYVAGMPLRQLPDKLMRTHRCSNVQLTYLSKDVLENGQLVVSDASNTVLARVNPSRPLNERFAGKRVLHTMIKDEPIEWIVDWMTYYHRIHGANALSLYDNGSTAYTPEELLDAIRNVDGYETIVVMPWDFPYGPQGAPWAGPDVPWDSTFTQRGAMDHARLRLLATCAGMLNVDIDEYVVPLDTVTVFDALGEWDSGTFLLHGLWIENTERPESDSLPRAWDFCYRKRLRTAQAKWAMVPSRVPFDKARCVVHALFVDDWSHDLPELGTRYEKRFDERFMFAHFLGLTRGWKRPDRLDTSSKDGLVVDVGLAETLHRAFPQHMDDDRYQQIVRETAHYIFEYRFKGYTAQDLRNARFSAVLNTLVSPHEWTRKAVVQKCYVWWTTDQLAPYNVFFRFYVGLKRTTLCVGPLDKAHLQELKELLEGKGLNVIKLTQSGLSHVLCLLDYDGTEEGLVAAAKEIACLVNQIIA